jgi:hypothetical protein
LLISPRSAKVAREETEGREAWTMDAPERPVWFAGDLDDPWIAAIADAIPGPVRRLNWPAEFDAIVLDVDSSSRPRVLVLHRALLTPGDAEQVARLRAGAGSVLRVVLCVGPHVRHADLERWSAVVDAVVPEATARDTIARHLAEGNEPASSPTQRPSVRIISGNHELRQTLTDACESLGYGSEPARDWTEASPRGLAVWDVPVLAADWPIVLARQKRSGPVVALLGFADRALVRLAREHGAAACLELPFDLADLGFVLDRLATLSTQPPHDVPPPPASRRLRDRKLAEPCRDAYN